MHLGRLLAGRRVPDLSDDDLLAIIPVSWILDIDYTFSPLTLEYTPEFGNAHFEIVGVIDQEFSVFLARTVEVITPEEWLRRSQSSPPDTPTSNRQDSPT